MIDALALVGVGLVVAALAVHVVYSGSVIATPRLAAALRPLLGWPRRVALLAGGGFALGAVVASPQGTPLLAGLAAALGLRHASRRQWAFGLRAHAAAPRDDVPDDAPVVLLPDGRAVPVAWLHAARLVRLDDVLLVGCSLAGSVAAFEVPPGGPVLVLHPLAVGFAIGGRRRWSGVTGEALDGGVDLTPVDLALGPARGATSRLGPASGALPSPSSRRVRIPGADAEDATDVGLVAGGVWSAAPFPEGPAPRRYLARWAARVAGLPGASG